MAKEEIEKLARGLEIPFLVHFTRVANLPSIMQHGLQPVAQINNLGLNAEINDHLRLDGRLNGLSTSIAFPNGSMFFRLRNENPEVEWAILALSPKILWEKDALFCRHNAADARVSGLSDDELRTPAAFSSLFEENDGQKSREEQRLKSFDPTDVQAEVLIMDAVEPDYIIGALFNTEAEKSKHEALFGTKKLLVHSGKKGLFANRTYYRQFGGG